MKRYRVRYLTEATETLRAAFLHVREDAGPRRAANWLSRIYASIDQLEIAPRATRAEGLFHGHEFRSLAPAQRKRPILIDEVQKVPAVLDEVHRLIEDDGLGFVLCGSSARKLKRGRSRSATASWSTIATSPGTAA